MNKSEREIYDEIIERVEYNKSINESWIGHGTMTIETLKEVWLYRKEHTYSDYLDWRKNLMTIDNFCRYTWWKIDKGIIKKELRDYFNNG